MHEKSVKHKPKQVLIPIVNVSLFRICVENKEVKTKISILSILIYDLNKFSYYIQQLFEYKAVVSKEI